LTGSRSSRNRSGIADYFKDKSEQCASAAKLERLLADATHELGFAYFALLHHSTLAAPARHLVRLDNYPSGWPQLLRRRLGRMSDPIHAASRRTNCGFPWDEAPRLAPLAGAQRAVLEESRHFGLGNGFTVPANVPGEPLGSCSFATRRGRPLPKTRLDIAEVIGGHAFKAARRICGLPAPPPPKLSPRELDCLGLVARGKTDWEIATILGLGLETVRTYVKHARQIYGVTSRTQLAIHGLRDALISFDDAIPPKG
jgi:LuxR family transcriptional regulator, quorum-sensing system regulator CciR